MRRASPVPRWLFRREVIDFTTERATRPWWFSGAAIPKMASRGPSAAPQIRMLTAPTSPLIGWNPSRQSATEHILASSPIES